MLPDCRSCLFISEPQAIRLLRERSWEVDRTIDDFFNDGMVPERVYVCLFCWLLALACSRRVHPLGRGIQSISLVFVDRAAKVSVADIERAFLAYSGAYQTVDIGSLGLDG